MPFTSTEIQNAGKAALDFYVKNKPIDQIGTERPLLKRLMADKKSFPGGKQYIVEQLRKSYDSNFQWFYGDGQVTYNKRQSLEQAQYAWRSCHDGFALSEDDLFQNGITLIEGKGGVNSGAERVQLTNLLQEHIEVLREGFEEKFDYELHGDGTQSTDAIEGLHALISPTPTTGTVGGLNRATYTWWRNKATTSIAAANLLDEMEKAWRACSRNGGRPNFIIAGEDFIDAYRAQANSSNRVIIQNGNMAQSEGATSEYTWHGVPIVWDPVFADLDTNSAFGSATYPWQKRCYFINTRHMRLRPAKGHDMVTRTPPRVYNRYTYYWGLTWKGGLTVNRMNAHAVLVIA